MKRTALLLACGCLVLSACATRPTAPESELGSARSALTSAEDAGAPLHARDAYQSARTKLEQAERARTAEDFVLARHLAVEATSAARLAAVTARAQQNLDMISELQMSNDELRSEIQAASAAMTRGDTP